MCLGGGGCRGISVLDRVGKACFHGFASENPATLAGKKSVTFGIRRYFSGSLGVSFARASHVHHPGGVRGKD